MSPLLGGYVPDVFGVLVLALEQAAAAVFSGIGWALRSSLGRIDVGEGNGEKG